MTDDPRSHQYNDADWQYEIDSVQRGGTTGQTRARRHGEVHTPKPSEGDDSDDSDEDQPGFDSLGIPTGDF